jgi:photosystem II stability/assembly factor-like uncharacterized protein
MCLIVHQFDTILVSMDGGASWHSHASGVLTELYGIACPANGTCLAVGQGGTILAGAAGGST